MSVDIYTTATNLAILRSGRAPVWVTGSSLTPPALVTDGAALNAAVITLLHVSMRVAPAHRTATLTLPGGAALTGNYTVTVDGNAVVYNATAGAPADLAALMTAITAAVVGNGTISAIVDAVDVASALILTGVGEEDFSIDFTHSGATVCEIEADPSTADLRMWWFAGARVGVTPPQIWTWDGDDYSVTHRGMVRRFETAGLDRVMVQLYNVAGHPGDGALVTYTDPIVSIGPCLSEI